MTVSVFEKMCEILSELKTNRLSYELRHNRDDAITVCVAVPGQRWELDVYMNGEIEFEVFRSDGSLYGESEFRASVVEYSK